MCHQVVIRKCAPCPSVTVCERMNILKYRMKICTCFYNIDKILLFFSFNSFVERTVSVNEKAGISNVCTLSDKNAPQ